MSTVRVDVFFGLDEPLIRGQIDAALTEIPEKYQPEAIAVSWGRIQGMLLVTVTVPRIDGKPRACSSADFSPEFMADAKALAMGITGLRGNAVKHQQTAPLPTEGV